MTQDNPQEMYESAVRSFVDSLKEANETPDDEEVLNELERAVGKFEQAVDEKDAVVQQRNQLAVDAAAKLQQAADAIEEQNYKDAKERVHNLQQKMDNVSEGNMSDQATAGSGRFSRREVVGSAGVVGVLGGAFGYLLDQEDGTPEAATDAQPASGSANGQAGRIAFGEEYDFSIDEGVALFEYVKRRTAYEGLPFDSDDLRVYSDGEGSEFAFIEAILEDGRPTDDSNVNYAVEYGDDNQETYESGGVDDGAVEIVLTYANHGDKSVREYTAWMENQ